MLSFWCFFYIFISSLCGFNSLKSESWLVDGIGFFPVCASSDLTMLAFRSVVGNCIGCCLVCNTKIYPVLGVS